MKSITWNEMELRLTTRGIVKIEEVLKKNLISIFVEDGKDRIPTVGEITLVLFYAIQPHVKNIDAVYDIVDKYYDNGGSFTDLVAVIVKLFQESGVLPKEVPQEEETKN